MAIEEPEYEILLTSGEVEVRAYKPYIVATVSVSGAAADRQAFRILANYIFGGNKTSQKMAMTAPVESRGGDYAFVMESRFSMARPSMVASTSALSSMAAMSLASSATASRSALE